METLGDAEAPGNRRKNASDHEEVSVVYGYFINNVSFYSMMIVDTALGAKVNGFN